MVQKIKHKSFWTPSAKKSGRKTPEKHCNKRQNKTSVI